MSEKDKEFRAFHVAKVNPDANKRNIALLKISRKGLLIRLIVECEFRDMRLGAIRRLIIHSAFRVTSRERELYLKLAINDRDPEIRMIAIKQVSPQDRDKLIQSPYPDVRYVLAKTTNWREGLLRLILDTDEHVRREAENSLQHKILVSKSEYSVN